MEQAVFLFEHKKTAYPPLPFKLGSYKFTKVKQAAEFIEELEKFHFGEMPFRRNDTHGKVAEHCKEHKVHFEYTHYFDREEFVFQNAPNMTALMRRFKKKITTKGGKWDEQAKAEEEAKRRDEEAQRLVKEAAERLHTEEERRASQEAAEKAEEAKRKLDEELRKQEAERIKLTQQLASETAAGKAQEVENPEVQTPQVPATSIPMVPTLKLVPFVQEKGKEIPDFNTVYYDHNKENNKEDREES